MNRIMFTDARERLVHLQDNNKLKFLKPIHMKRLFTYSVILHEYNDKKEYLDSKIIIQPTSYLAKSEKEVLFKVTREIPEEHTKNPDNIEILVRNF